MMYKILGLENAFHSFILLVIFLFSSYNELVFSASVRIRNDEAENLIQPTVRFNSDGTLKIVQFTDLHYGEAPNSSVGPEDDTNTTQVIKDILDWENPDFVVFTGDLVTGDFMLQNVSKYINMMLQPVVEKRLRWASVYGNHDTGPMVSRLEILRTEQSYGELCYTQQMEPDLPGVSNYYIPIYAPSQENESKGQPEIPVMLWWFLDSQGGYTLNGRQPFYIDQWCNGLQMKAKNFKMSGDNYLPWFFSTYHPMHACKNTAWTVSNRVEHVSVQDNILGNPLCSGLVDDIVTPQEKDTGIMNALLQVGGVRTIFVGHEHGNSWCCFYKEIEICYNRHTGYGGYGEWIRGARVIELDVGDLQNQTNYVRLENGEIADVFPRGGGDNTK